MKITVCQEGLFYPQQVSTCLQSHSMVNDNAAEDYIVLTWKVVSNAKLLGAASMLVR